VTTIETAPPEPPPGEPLDRPPWRPWTAPAALLLGVFGALMVGSVVLVAASLITGHTHGNSGAKIIATALGDVAFVGAAVFFAQLGAPPTPAQFGLRPTRVGPAVFWALVAYAAFFAFAAGWLAALGITSKDHSLDDIDNTTAALVATAVLVTMIAPVAEELLFRGYIFTALRGWVGVWGAAAIDGVLFGAIHLDPDRPVGFLVPLAVLGFVLCLLYWRTGSLLPCIAVHSLNNSFALAHSEGWPAWGYVLMALGALGALALAYLPFVPRARPA
jgi:uncharacterized protein